MVSSVILLDNGYTCRVTLPPTAQEVASTWTHRKYFSHGVKLAEMIHLSRECVEQMGLNKYTTKGAGGRPELVSISLMISRMSNNLLPPNVHPMPSLLKGHVLVLITIDGSTCIPCTVQRFYALANCLFTVPASGPKVVEEDNGELCDMSISSSSGEDSSTTFNWGTGGLFSLDPHFGQRKTVQIRSKPVF